MIQDIFPKKLFNEYRPGKRAGVDCFVLCFEGDTVLTGEGAPGSQKIVFPTRGMLDGVSDDDIVYAFSIDDTEYFLNIGAKADAPFGFGYRIVRDIRGYASNEDALIVFTGYHLHKWYTSNRFCGCCGEGLSHSDRERALICPACGNTVYPRLNPAVIVGVRSEGRLLVTKYRGGFAYYALIAGFSEIGETLEETVAREVMEETGIRVKNIQYYKSQPWGMAQDILAGFYCEADGDTTIHIDADELKLAKWCTPDEIELQPGSLSLTNEMMRMFKEGRI